jgi:predicted nuclease of predicted toxin-antitoxin system
VIFVNGSIPRSAADELTKIGKDAKWKGELFPLDTKDPVWLRAAGINGWIVITRDKRIRSRPGEREAIMAHSVGCFILTYRNDLKRDEIARVVLASIDAIEEKFRTTPRPFIYTVSKDGEFREYARSGL